MDGTRGDSVQEVHVSERRVVDGNRMLGGDVVRRTAVLELVKPGRDQEYRERIQVCFILLYDKYTRNNPLTASKGKIHWIGSLCFSVYY